MVPNKTYQMPVVGERVRIDVKQVVGVRMGDVCLVWEEEDVWRVTTRAHPEGLRLKGLITAVHTFLANVDETVVRVTHVDKDVCVLRGPVRRETPGILYQACCAIRDAIA